MSAPRDTTQVVRSWLHEDAHENAERVLDLVLDEIDTTPQRRAGWLARRFPPVNSNFVRVALAAAVVVVIALVGSRFLGNSNAGGPGASDTPPATATPTAIPEQSSLLPKGPHRIWDAWGDRGEITITISAAGWYGQKDAGFIIKDNNPSAPDGAGLLVAAESDQGFGGMGDVYVYGDPCHWATTKPDTPVTTVDEAVAALTSQASRDASTPVDVTVAGFAGKSITLHVPDDVVFSECDEGEFRSWIEGRDGTRYHQDPGQIDRLWVLDVGDPLYLVIIDAGYYGGTPQSVLDEIEALVQSMTFE